MSKVCQSMTSLTLSRKAGGPSPNEELLRLDSRGRARTGRERRERLLAEFDRSGLSGARFARLTGINYQTFAGWLHQRRNRKAGVKRPKAVTWVEAAVRPPDTETKPLRVELPGGAWMDLSCPAQIEGAAQLLRELAKEGGLAC
jgi:hypothetical protein